MHELITRSIECFIRDTYNEPFWMSCLGACGLSGESTDTLYRANARDTIAIVEAAAHALGKQPEYLLEDLGTYLVSHRNCQRLRRLLRFSGETFEDFLHSLDDLPGRARLAVGDLILPSLELWEEAQGQYRLDVGTNLAGFESVLLGALRAMADDYGALVLIEIDEAIDRDQTSAQSTRIFISLLDGAFAEGKDFDLSSMLSETRIAPSGV